MKANVQPQAQSAKVLAGMFGNETEFFFHQNKPFGMNNGTVKPQTELPYQLNHDLYQEYLADELWHKNAKKMGYPGVKEGYEKWKFCNFAGLDTEPDFKNGHFTQDAFNNACHDETCQFRGKVCGRESGITTEDFKTLKCIVSGLSDKQAAERLYLSVSGMKTRRETLKKKLSVSNGAELAAHATQLGITPYQS